MPSPLTSSAATRRAAAVCTAVLIAMGVWSDATRAAATSLLWRVTNGRATVYLAGSIHMLTPEYYPLNPALTSAFAESDLLMEEIDFNAAQMTDAQLQMLMRGMLPASQTLDTVISAETFALVSKRVAQLGLPLEPLKRFKPWSLALTLLGMEWQGAGFNPDLGLDKHFYDLAQTRKMAFQALETVEYQISRFDELSMPEQDRLLASTLKELDTQKAAVTQLMQAWKAGDAATIERIVLQDVKDEPLIYQRLLVDRNQMWLPQIEALFSRQGRAFVVVGAAHLVGPDGLLALLRAKGYTLEQL
jgi:uncharacterized protein YbaP (TraB family)